MFGMQTLSRRDALGLEDRSQDDLVGQCEALHKVNLEDVTAERVRAWFEHCPQPAPRVRFTQSAERLPNGRRVMSEIVNDSDAANDGTDLQATFDALEGCQRFND